MQRVLINGTSINIQSGRNVTIANGRVLVDGRDVTPGESGPVIQVEIHGDVNRLDVEVCEAITIHGAVGSVKSQCGDVTCGPVSGSVQTMSGDVRCGEVGGDVNTMSGDIRRG